MNNGNAPKGLNVFEIYIGDDSLYRWRFKAANGVVLCHGQAHSNRDSVLKDISCFRELISLAEVKDLI